MSTQEPPQSELRASLQQNSRRKRGVIIGVIIAVVVAAIIAVVAIVLGGRGGSSDEAGGADAGATTAEAQETLQVRIALAEDLNWFDTLVDVAAEKGLEIDFVNTDDWVLPNTELIAGSVDANAFQHNLYLSAFNVENEADLTPVFSTVILPWGIFSAEYDSLDELPDGSAIAIPDDPSNGARALNLLQSAELITLDASAGLFPTVEDVTDNPKNLTFSEVQGLSLPQHYDDPGVAAVVVGAGYFDPSKGITNADALYLDDPEAEENLPYVNILVTNADDTENPAWAILKEAYADPRVAEALDAEFGDTQILIDIPAEDLRASLAELEEFARQSSQ